MHDAGAMVAGGSLRAVEAILRGDVEHAFHPGGGLHHAMPDRASGFCIYDDPALAIARARRDGLRVLYVDLDVHHGDGVQAIHWSDPGVLTVSFHETGRYLFPGTGGVGELGEGAAAGTSVNVPLEPETGEGAWLGAVQVLLPELAAAFGPDLVVSQHGADSHAWDPLAHLRVTTTAMGEAARLVDRLAHRSAGGRWLATGGGGYDAYRVVPRSWSLVWLAGAHREVPAATPLEWRERWAAEGARYGQAPLPATFEDAPNAGLELDASQAVAEARSLETAGARAAAGRAAAAAGRAGPRLVGSARGRFGARLRRAAPTPGVGRPAIIHPRCLDLGAAHARARASWRRPTRSSVMPSSLPRSRDGASVSAAVEGTLVVGLAVAGPADDHGRREILRARRGAGVPAARSGVRAPRGLRHRRAARATPITAESRSPNVIRSSRSSEAFGPTIARRLLEAPDSRSARPTRTCGGLTPAHSRPFARRSATRTQADCPPERWAAAAAPSAAALRGCGLRLLRDVPRLMLDFGPRRRPSHSLCPWTASSRARVGGGAGGQGR